VCIGFNKVANLITTLLTVRLHFSYIKNSRGFNTPRYEVDLTLEEYPPEWMPMYGKKVRIFYPGMKIQCNACYGVGHMKRECKNERVGWMGYVSKLKDSGKFEATMFGSWLEEKPMQEKEKKKETSEGDLRTLLDNPGSLQRALADFLHNRGGRRDSYRGQRDRSNEDERNRGRGGKNARRGRNQSRNQGQRYQDRNRRN
jgi:hypothetical protein